MSNNQNPRILRILKIVLDILFGLLTIVSGFLVLWIVFSPFIISSTGIAITSSVPVAIGEDGEPRMEVEIAAGDSDRIRWAFLDEAQGTLRMETTDRYMIFISNLARLLTALGISYLIYLLRTVVISVQHGEVFTEQNVKRIRRLGYLVLGLSLAQAFFEYIAAYEVLRQVNITSPPLSVPSPFEPGVILASLLILALAQVWGYGLELERDRALTI